MRPGNEVGNSVTNVQSAVFLFYVILYKDFI